MRTRWEFRYTGKQNGIFTESSHLDGFRQCIPFSDDQIREHIPILTDAFTRTASLQAIVTLERSTSMEVGTLVSCRGTSHGIG